VFFPATVFAGKQTRFLSTLKNLAAACFPFSSANLITFNLKEKLYLCLALFLDYILNKSCGLEIGGEGYELKEGNVRDEGYI
jgi:hypothetical protein